MSYRILSEHVRWSALSTPRFCYRWSHFGSATDPVAGLWSGGIDRPSPTHPLGNNDEFHGVSPLFQRPELASARPVILLGMVPQQDWPRCHCKPSDFAWVRIRTNSRRSLRTKSGSSNLFRCSSTY